MKTLVNTLVAFFSISALLLMFTGCDTESADENNVTISPKNVTLAEGESMSFTAAGGFDYEWTLEDNEWGTLSTLKGPTTVYTSLKNSTSNSAATVKTLVVSSVIYGSGSDSNSTDEVYSETHSAEAYISHIAEPTSGLHITPSSASVSANDIITFTASGGSGTYTWTLTSTTNGNISSDKGDKTVYVANGNSVSAQTVLTLTSSTENEVAIITHNP
jgi:hypothetical protein